MHMHATLLGLVEKDSIYIWKLNVQCDEDEFDGWLQLHALVLISSFFSRRSLCLMSLRLK